MSQQLGLNLGAHDGIKRAADHAEQEKPGWGDRALSMLRTFVLLHERSSPQFTAPQVRGWAAKSGLDEPPSNYAWGGVFLRARKIGMIVPAGYAQHGDDTMHTQSVRLWTRGHRL